MGAAARAWIKYCGWGLGTYAVLDVLLSQSCRVAGAFGSSKTSAARITCRNIDSIACLPFLAQAVAVKDVIYMLTTTQNPYADPLVWLTPSPGGVVRKCSDGIVQSSGESLLQTTLGRSDLKDEQYWTRALFVTAVNTNCN
jgi:hypothetical protein